jgi:hypothetical protein
MRDTHGDRMRRLLSIAALALLPALLGAQAGRPAETPYVVAGRIVDERGLTPLAGVRVSVVSGRDTIGSTAADSLGRYALVLPRGGDVVIHLRRLGYQRDSITARVRDGEPETVNLALAPAAGTRELPRVVATARRDHNGFEERARRSGSVGSYFRRADIARTGASRTSDIVARVPGLTTSDSAGVTLVLSPRMNSFGSMRLPLPGVTSRKVLGDSVQADSTSMRRGTSCVVRVVVDGRLMHESFSVNDVPLEEIEAMEIYRGPAGVPAEYSSTRGNTSCGLVMIWRRSTAGAP